MVYIGVPAGFYENATQYKFVLSWFNRVNKTLRLGAGNLSTTSVAQVLVGAAILMLKWGEEATYAIWSGQAQTDGSYMRCELGIDGTTQFAAGTYVYNAANPAPVHVGGFGTAGEGFHTYQITLGAQSGSGTAQAFNTELVGMTRG
jgi:hypothetical protein